jgi:predicted transcriptional regulator
MKMPKFMLRGRTHPREAMMTSLGALERRTLEEVWRLCEVSVRQIESAFGETVAYTTVMTTLDRLYKKGLLTRRKSGRAFLYAARFSPEELERGLAEDVISGLLDTATERVEPVLSCIVDAVSERDRDLLDDLERLVRQKRLEMDSQEKK